MKNRYIAFIGAALLLTLTACEGFLDITPEGQVKRKEQLSTPSGIEDAMYGVYSLLSGSSLYGKEMSYNMLDVLAQCFEAPGNYKVESLLEYDYEYSAVESTIDAVWTKMYNNISNVNSVLTCDLVKEATEYPYKIYRGEGLALRAMMHFDLLRLFTEQITLNPEAEGIPYATDFSLVTPEFVKAEKVYERILADLLLAEELLADEASYAGKSPFMTMRQIHLNIHAVRALLARVYFTKGDYTNAKHYAQQVIDESGQALLQTTQLRGAVAGILSDRETLFGVYSSAAFYNNVYEDLWLKTSFYSLNPREDYAAAYEENGASDYRLNAYFETQMTGEVRFIKVLDKYKVDGAESSRPAGQIPGINMIRLPEMYYILAECLARESTLGESTTTLADAIAMLDKVRVSRGLVALTETDVPTADRLIEEINKERSKELIGEGQIFFNMKRLNLPITTIEGSYVEASKKVYVLPIPDAEYEYRY